jgi:hypothetical protein
MTVNVSDLRTVLRAAADQAAFAAKDRRAHGDEAGAEFHSGRQAAFLTALNLLDQAEDQKANEVDEAHGEGVDLAAVARLERLGQRRYALLDDDHVLNRLDSATETGALDQASGTVYSDADGGL